MKDRIRLLGLISLLSPVLLTSCDQAQPGDDLTTTEGAVVQSGSLWEPMDTFNTGVWSKGNWSNGGMFNCGWLPDHISFSGGAMTIKLDNVSSSGKPYSSGEYRSNNTFNYGVFETNMKSAAGNGLVSSFFTYTGSPWDEIDVEILGKNTRQVSFNYFVSGVGNHTKVVDLGFDSAASFHKYKIEWGNGYINWYVDGVWKWGVNNTGLNAPYGAAMPSHPMQIMMNLWPGTGVDSWLNPFTYSGPRYAVYDYVSYNPK